MVKNADFTNCIRTVMLWTILLLPDTDDLSRIFPCCYAGVIASTGWDSFTVSSLEMASSGLPLVVSNLQGLSESIEADVTGFLLIQEIIWILSQN